MPNSRSQRVDMATGEAEIVWSDGSKTSIAPAPLKALHDAQTGNLAQRRTKVRDLVFGGKAALVDPATVTFTYDAATGKVTGLTVEG